MAVDRDANAPAYHVFDMGVVLGKIIPLERLGLLILRRSSLVEDLHRLRLAYEELSGAVYRLRSPHPFPDVTAYDEAAPTNLQKNLTKYAGRFGLTKDAQVLVHCLHDIRDLIAEAPKHGQKRYRDLVKEAERRRSRIKLGLDVAYAMLDLKV